MTKKLDLTLGKYWTYPMNSYLSKKGNETHLEAGYTLKYGEYTDNNNLNNGNKVELLLVIGEYNQYNSLQIALTDNKNNILATQDTSINTLIPGKTYNFTISYNNEQYIINLNIAKSTEIKTDDNRSNFVIGNKYENEYAKVFFNVDAPYYQHSKNYIYTKEEKNEFYDEVYNIFKSLGWEITEQKGCDYIHKGKQKLYLHPDQFSGEILKDEIITIHEALQNGITFNSRWTDVYEDYFDITDEDYSIILTEQAEDIKNDLLKEFQTKRRNLYITGSMQSIERVIKKYSIKRIGKRFNSNKVEFDIVCNIFDKLIEDDFIVTAQTKNGKGYRTNKDLLKELKIAI